MADQLRELKTRLAELSTAMDDLLAREPRRQPETTEKDGSEPPPAP